MLNDQQIENILSKLSSKERKLLALNVLSLNHDHHDHTSNQRANEETIFVLTDGFAKLIDVGYLYRYFVKHDEYFGHVSAGSWEDRSKWLLSWKKVITYTPHIPAGQGPTFVGYGSNIDVLTEVVANILEDHPLFPIDSHHATWRDEVAALKPGEEVTWKVEDDEYTIVCAEMTEEEYRAMPEFNGY